jgi:biotin transport system ATP-binding protein
MPVIDVRGVTHRFDDRPSAAAVLRDVSVTMSEQRVGVVGANGSGKSTFARLINGLVVPTQGEVTVDGLSTARQGREVRQRVGFCFTDPDAQIIMPTVGEDVAYSLRSSGLPDEEASARVEGILSRFQLAHLSDHPSHLLSGGQKQLLALAAVLIRDPDIVVMDEPTTLLDLRNTRMIGEVIAGLPHQVVLVTHHLDLLADFERVLVFDEGRIVCDDVPAVALDRYVELSR